MLVFHCKNIGISHSKHQRHASCRLFEQDGGITDKMTIETDIYSKINNDFQNAKTTQLYKFQLILRNTWGFDI